MSHHKEEALRHGYKYFKISQLAKIGMEQQTRLVGAATLQIIELVLDLPGVRQALHQTTATMAHLARQRNR